MEPLCTRSQNDSKVRGWELGYLGLESKMILISIYLDSIYLLAARSKAQELRPVLVAPL